MVTGIEADAGRRLAAAEIKSLTGGDTVTARFMYREYFEFLPRFKVWLAANHRPVGDPHDDALWRRIVNVPFLHQLGEAERDGAVKETLTTDPLARAAVLAWAVDGAREWRRRRLRPPRAVREYTARYREENEPLAAWIEDCCELDPGAVALSRDLWASYQAWCEENGESPTSSASFSRALTALGCTPIKRGGQRARAGLRLRLDGGTGGDAPTGDSHSGPPHEDGSQNEPSAGVQASRRNGGHA